MTARFVTPFTPVFDPEKKTGGIRTGSTPAGAASLGQVVIGGVGWLALTSTHAFVGVYSLDAVKAIDITDLNNPTIVDTLTDATQLSGPLGVAVDGDYLYVACDDDRLTAVDISDPTSMSVAGTLVDATQLDDLRDVKIDGNLAYLVANSSSLTTSRIATVNISNPASMSVSASVASTTYNQARAVRVADDYAYMISDSSTGPLTVFDVAAAPSVTGSESDSGLTGAKRLFLAGNYIYTAGSFGQWVSVVDVSDTANPLLVAEYDDPSSLSTNDIIVYGSTVFVSLANSPAATNPQTLARFNISTPASPSLIGTTEFVGVENLYQMAFSGSHLVATAGLANGDTVLGIFGPY